MELKKENLLAGFAPRENDDVSDFLESHMEGLRAEQLFKIAEFLHEYFEGEYTEELFQCRCQWCRVQLNPDFFKKLTEAAEINDPAQRLEIMNELHIYVEDFLIAFCEEFFTTLDGTSKNLVIYAGDFLHGRMKVEKLEKFLHLTGLLKEENKENT